MHKITSTMLPPLTHTPSSFLALIKVIGIELLAQSLLPAIKDLAEDKHWRVRLAIVEHIPLLASQLGPEFFHEKLGPQCMKSLEDQVASIREATAKTLQKIAQDFGADWAREHLVPQVRAPMTIPSIPAAVPW